MATMEILRARAAAAASQVHLNTFGDALNDEQPAPSPVIQFDSPTPLAFPNGNPEDSPGTAVGHTNFVSRIKSKKIGWSKRNARSWISPMEEEDSG
jgi:hypothetical protein